MRIRSIKPEFWRSEDVAALDWPTRLLFIGLWSYVDDNGVGVDDERLIAADLFALEEDQAAVRESIRDGLATLSRRSLITRFEGDRKRFLFVTKWDQHQKIDKPARPRYARPDGVILPGNAGVQGVLDVESRQSRDNLATVSRLEQRNRGTEEQGNSNNTTAAPPRQEARDLPAALRAPFDEFWKLYPRKVGKAEARRKFAVACRSVAPETVVAAAARYATATRGKDPQYVAHPATWLHQGRWEDEATPRPPVRSQWDTAY